MSQSEVGVDVPCAREPTIVLNNVLGAGTSSLVLQQFPVQLKLCKGNGLARKQQTWLDHGTERATTPTCFKTQECHRRFGRAKRQPPEPGVTLQLDCGPTMQALGNFGSLSRLNSAPNRRSLPPCPRRTASLGRSPTSRWLSGFRPSPPDRLHRWSSVFGTPTRSHGPAPVRAPAD